ncbi:MAG: DUF1285 domain-containing protein [Pseudomonadota bacterium]
MDYFMADGGTALNKLGTQISRGQKAAKRPIPPVEDWNPPFCGDIDMEIRSDGSWYYLGTPIGRPSLVQLFASVLRKDEDGKTYLVTPVEKVGIRVRDAHFTIVRIDRFQRDHRPWLQMTSNIGEEIIVGPENPLRFEFQNTTKGVKPYLKVRGRLEALLSRSCMHELIDMGEEIELDGVMQFAVRSGPYWYPIMTVDALNEALAS